MTLRNRSAYAAVFDAIEAVVTGFAVKVIDARKSGQLTAQGIQAQLYPDAYDAGRARIDEVRQWAEADQQAADDILSQPEPMQAANTLAALQYRQNIELRRWEGSKNASAFLAELGRVIDTGDAIGAQVLSDLAPAVVQPTGLDDLQTSLQLTELREEAIRLRAEPERLAALELKDLLDGDRQNPGVVSRVRFVSGALGPRLSMIVQDGGEDRLPGLFKLNGTLPPDARNFVPTSADSLRGAYARFIPSVLRTRSAG